MSLKVDISEAEKKFRCRLPKPIYIYSYMYNHRQIWSFSKRISKWHKGYHSENILQIRKLEVGRSQESKEAKRRWFGHDDDRKLAKRAKGSE